jgi:hypothetical protein
MDKCTCGAKLKEYDLSLLSCTECDEEYYILNNTLSNVNDVNI